MALRIVVAGDNLLVRERVMPFSFTAPDLEVVASCDDYDAAVAAAEQLQPDVVATDVAMGGKRPTTSVSKVRGA